MNDLGLGGGPVVRALRLPQPHVVAVLQCDNSKAVVLQLVQPAIPWRRRRLWCGASTSQQDLSTNGLFQLVAHRAAGDPLLDADVAAVPLVCGAPLPSRPRLARRGSVSRRQSTRMYRRPGRRELAADREVDLC